MGAREFLRCHATARLTLPEWHSFDAPRIHPPPDAATFRNWIAFMEHHVFCFWRARLCALQVAADLLRQMIHMRMQAEVAFKPVADIPKIWWEALILWVGVVLAVGLLSLACFDNARGGGEPNSFILGISIWPTEMLRLVAATIAGCSFVHAWFAFKRDAFELGEDFDLGSPGTVSMRANMTDIRRQWSNFLERTKFTSRMMRALLYSGLVLMFSFAVVELFGSLMRPYRGWRSDYADLFFLLLAGGGLLLLTTWTVDATIQSTTLVENLSEPENQWPQKVTANWTHRFPMAPAAAIANAIDVDFFGRRTESVYKVFHLPLVVLAVLVFGPSRLVRTLALDKFHDRLSRCCITVAYLLWMAIAGRRGTRPQARHLATEKNRSARIFHGQC